MNQLVSKSVTFLHYGLVQIKHIGGANRVATVLLERVESVTDAAWQVGSAVRHPCPPSVIDTRAARHATASHSLPDHALENPELCNANRQGREGAPIGIRCVLTLLGDGHAAGTA
jgi:hypothetical protein